MNQISTDDAASYVPVRILQNVTTKRGRAFSKGEVTLARRVDYGDGLDWSCVSSAHGMRTLLSDAQVEEIER
jgi:hypothetical protein